MDLLLFIDAQLDPGDGLFVESVSSSLALWRLILKTLSSYCYLPTFVRKVFCELKYFCSSYIKVHS